MGSQLFLTTTAENEAVHSQYLMMMGIMILILVLGTTIPLSMKKKVKISMTNPPYQGKQRKISNEEGDPANRFQSRDHHPPLHAKKSRKIHGYLPQQQPHIETLKKYIFSNDHQRKG